MIRRRFVMLFATLAAVGCSDGGQPVTGTVTRGGVPLSGGTVLLEPVESGPSSTAAVAAGEFTVPAARGLKPGKYKVHVSPPPLPSGSDLKLVEETQFPAWESTVEVVPGQPIVLALPKEEPGEKPKPRPPGKP
jgi:hypothetical protein